MIGTRQQQWIVGASATAGVLLIAAILLAHRHGTPAKDQHTLDSLQITKPIFQANQDSLVKRETLYVRRVDTLRTIVTRLVTTSNELHAQADSFAAVARVASDSAASKWQMAYTLRTREADTLRAALDTTTKALDAEHQAHLAADLRADNASTRLTASEDLNARLATDIKKASECKILFLRCPSRGVMFVAGVVSVETAHVLVTRKFP